MIFSACMCLKQLYRDPQSTLCQSTLDKSHEYSKWLTVEKQKINWRCVITSWDTSDKIFSIFYADADALLICRVSYWFVPFIFPTAQYAESVCQMRHLYHEYWVFYSDICVLHLLRSLSIQKGDTLYPIRSQQLFNSKSYKKMFKCTCYR